MVRVLLIVADPIDLFSYGSNCSTNFNVVVDSTSECILVNGSLLVRFRIADRHKGTYQEVQSGGSTIGQLVFDSQDLCSSGSAVFAMIGLVVL